jgi:hypothetical protein
MNAYASFEVELNCRYANLFPFKHDPKRKNQRFSIYNGIYLYILSEMIDRFAKNMHLQEKIYK